MMNGISLRCDLCSLTGGERGGGGVKGTPSKKASKVLLIRMALKNTLTDVSQSFYGLAC